MSQGEDERENILSPLISDLNEWECSRKCVCLRINQANTKRVLGPWNRSPLVWLYWHWMGGTTNVGKFCMFFRAAPEMVTPIEFNYTHSGKRVERRIQPFACLLVLWNSKSQFSHLTFAFVSRFLLCSGNTFSRLFVLRVHEVQFKFHVLFNLT